MSAERKFGPVCPGCTLEIISARIDRFPPGYSTCVRCRDSGALHHSRLRVAGQEQQNDRDHEDAQKCARREGGGSNGKAHAKS